MQISYSQQDKNTSIILLHGWGGTAASLAKLRDALDDEGLQTFSFDLPGFGETPLTQTAMSLDDYVEYLKVYILENNIFRPVLVGHSFGGKLAMAFALKYPELMSKLVLVNASGVFPRNTIKRGAFLSISKVAGAVVSLPIVRAFKPWLRKLFYIYIVRERDYLRAEELQETLKNIIATDLDQQLPMIQASTLIIWGEVDTVTPLWQGKQIAAAIPNSRLEVVAEARHNLPIIGPGVVCDLIVNFLRK
jgi:pimeloyl-ACP methyl ester carboxylesterase